VEPVRAARNGAAAAALTGVALVGLREAAPEAEGAADVTTGLAAGLAAVAFTVLLTEALVAEVPLTPAFPIAGFRAVGFRAATCLAAAVLVGAVLTTAFATAAFLTTAFLTTAFLTGLVGAATLAAELFFAVVLAAGAFVALPWVAPRTGVARFADAALLGAGASVIAEVAFFAAILGPFNVARDRPPRTRTGGVRIRPSCSGLNGETPPRAPLVPDGSLSASPDPAPG